ncbi:MAG TPA: DNA polymerase III subunit alpha [Saprospiraceae bacterium]|nr:DNA polymerase III subunit alpha [Saprospiraceae bacterium]
MQDFCHLHCHTQYSLLDGASDITALMEKAVKDGQQAIALTDHGNMFGAFKFVKAANKKGIKPIVGCEFYMVENRWQKSFEKSKGQRDERFHQLLLAKNEVGYRNLSKLCSLGFIEGMYGKFPRIDKELLLKHHEGLIATSCCIGAEIPQAIASGNTEKAEKLLKWWLDLLGEDYYIELQRHRGIDRIDGSLMSQEDVNQVLLQLAKKYNVKTIVTNDVHYVEEEDAAPHDVLLCVNTGSLLSEDSRFKFPSSDFYLKTKAEINQLFGDVPHAIENTMEIASKVESLKLSRDVLLPAFPLPKEFLSQDDYLRHLTFEGARKKYGTITKEIEDRLNFELDTIGKSGYPGYFLIVQDFTTSAREMGVSVGPGRGSAAGSAVAYSLGITNIDPIRYDLLFERFLNPERISMPDIDIDFDDEGRDKVIDYVIDKYGRNQVAQIITYGTMAARTSLRDTGRVMNIPLDVVDRVAKSFPAHLSATLDAVLAEKDVSEKLKNDLNKDDLDRAYKFRELAAENSDVGHMIRTAKKIEGSVRSTGVHACGVIITPEDISNIIPIATAKDSDLVVSQFDNSVAEEAGLLKMDFLGLKTLTIIKDALKLIKETHDIEIDIDKIDLEDKLTYQLFQRGDTIGIFQYESPGMQKYLKDLKPNKFEDLIAMNALYRPGPIQYIPNFIERKHGREKITYDLPDMEGYLKETYGITVYQEQVMLLSQKLANFTKGEADLLRKAMGKKNRKLIDETYPKFLEGCKANGHPEPIIEKIWKDWEAFASYAFNKSHSTCYAFLAFQTAYLKAHYAKEFMASVLNHNKGEIKSLNFFITEAKRMGIKVLGPDVNESQLNFSIANKEYIRFGLSALKGVGEGPVEELIEERKKGHYKDIFDMMRRVNLRSINKKLLDSLAMGGALDSFQLARAQYFAPSGGFESFIEHLIRYGNNFQSQKDGAQASLFGEMHQAMIAEPQVPECEEWHQLLKLEKEKDITGFYLSGHPLDQYSLEFSAFINARLDDIENLLEKGLKLGGFITDVNVMQSKRGTNYARFSLQDYSGSYEFTLFNEQYESFKHLLVKGNVIYMEGIYGKQFNGDRMFFKVKDMKLLDTIGKLFTKSITLRIPLAEVDQPLVNGLSALVTENKGDHRLRIIVADEEEGDNDLELVPTASKVNASYDFVDGLKKMNIAYKLN